MNRIKSIQLGVIAICIATVPLSLAQTPRTRTSGSNQTGVTTTVAPRYTGSSGNITRPTQIGINAGSATNIGTNLNAGPHTAPNAGVQTGVSNQTIGIISAATGKSALSGISTGTAQTGINAASATNIGANTATNIGGAQTGINNQTIGITSAATGRADSSGNSTGATQTGINAATGTNTKANTNAGAQTGTAPAASTGVKTTQPQLVIETDPLPVFPSPTPFPTPIPTPTPIPSPSVGPSPSPSP